MGAMSCTTILVGRNASIDGSTLVARNDDSGSGRYDPKRFVAVNPADQPRHYVAEISHVESELPDDPCRYAIVPNALPGRGVLAEAGANVHGVAMSATETIAVNERVLAADPMVELKPAANGKPEIPGGIGEEDFITLVLPYVSAAREGVRRLGALLEEYGTYEANGIAISDADEIWYVETIGGHHWIARRVPDDCYAAIPNQLGLDDFDLDDAFGEAREHMCSADLREFIADNRLDTAMEPGDGHINPRHLFGTCTEKDHIYNTPRAWYMQRFLNPSDRWDGPAAAYRPESDDIPWSRVPERKVTIEDVKYVLSAHYQGTPFDPYGKGSEALRGKYRPIGINRNGQLAVLQLRPYAEPAYRAVQWMAFGSNAFNALVPFYGNVDELPEYLSNTGKRVSTESFYWANRLIGALADARFHDNANAIERYQEKMGAFGHRVLRETDAAVRDLPAAEVPAALAAANDRVAIELREQTDALLGKVLYTTSMGMKNGFAMSDN